MKTDVSLVKCSSYDYRPLKESLIKCLENLGGIKKFVKEGERVLIKPNLLCSRNPSEGVTTHPLLIRALAEILLEMGALVIIADSPGGPFNKRWLKRVYDGCKINEIVAPLGVELNYNCQVVSVKTEGLLLKKLDLAQIFLEVDKVISFSKLKTHSYAMFTGAVKNLFGAVPGILKAEYHLRMPNIQDFSNMLIDVALTVKPTLSLMDAILGMEGAGPSAGTPRPIGAILGSPSPFHLDVIATTLIGIESKNIPTIKESINRKLCQGTLEDISLSGDPISELIIKDFKVPNIYGSFKKEGIVLSFTKNIVKRMLRPKPVINMKKCLGCEICSQNCPPKIISVIKNKASIKWEECIRCFCCQELCPQKAINIRRPLISKIILG